MAKTLLVWGASLEHVDFVRAVRAAGYRVITADPNAAAPAHARADLSVYSSDEDAVLAIAGREGVNGVLAPFSNADTPLVSRLAQKLQAPGMPEAAARVLASRERFREFLTELALPHPQTHVVKRGTELPSAILEAHRWVLREDNCSGRGAQFIASAEDAQAAMQRVLGDGLSEVGLLERYIQGQNCLCSILLRNGQIEHSWFMDRAMGEGVHTVGLRAPSKLGHYPRKQAMQLIKQALESLKLTNGLFLAEFISSENKVYLLDLAPRLPGYGGIELLWLSAGVDLATIAAMLACGEELPRIQEREERAWGVVRLAPRAAGRLEFDVVAAEMLGEQNWVRGLTWHVPRGTRIESESLLAAEAGRVFVTGRDRDAVDARAAEVVKRLDVKAAP